MGKKAELESDAESELLEARRAMERMCGAREAEKIENVVDNTIVRFLREIERLKACPEHRSSSERKILELAERNLMKLKGIN